MAKYIGYVGTYTKEKSEGVYTFSLDTESAEINDVKVAANLDNPTYVTVSKGNQNLYAVSKEGERGGVTAFSVNDQTGELTYLNSQASEGSPPCHVSVKSDNSQVVTANYHTKKVESYLTNTDGTVKPGVEIEHEGSGPHPRQEKPHIHFAGFTPDEKYVIAIDLGSDKVISYEASKGTLSMVSTFETKPGSGPRHITFHPNGKYAYVMTELSSEVLVLSYNENAGSFTELQAISTIPDDFSETNDGSAIHISSDGRFIYAGNRGHNSIAVFRVNEASGLLTFVDWTSTEGNWPRDFVLDPSEQFVVVANQKSNNLVLFRRDENTGKLTPIQIGVEAPEAVCVKFLHA